MKTRSLFGGAAMLGGAFCLMLVSAKDAAAAGELGAQLAANVAQRIAASSPRRAAIVRDLALGGVTRMSLAAPPAGPTGHPGCGEGPDGPQRCKFHTMEVIERGNASGCGVDRNKVLGLLARMHGLSKTQCVLVRHIFGAASDNNGMDDTAAIIGALERADLSPNHGRVLSAIVNGSRSDGINADKLVSTALRTQHIDDIQCNLTKDLLQRASSNNGMDDDAAVQGVLGRAGLTVNHARVLSQVMACSRSDGINADKCFAATLRAAQIDNIQCGLATEVLRGSSSNNGMDDDAAMQGVLDHCNLTPGHQAVLSAMVKGTKNVRGFETDKAFRATLDAGPISPEKAQHLVRIFERASENNGMDDTQVFLDVLRH